MLEKALADEKAKFERLSEDYESVVAQAQELSRKNDDLTTQRAIEENASGKVVGLEKRVEDLEKVFDAYKIEVLEGLASLCTTCC